MKQEDGRGIGDPVHKYYSFPSEARDFSRGYFTFGKTIRSSIISERKSELSDLEDTKTALTLKPQNMMAFTWNGVKVFI